VAPPERVAVTSSPPSTQPACAPRPVPWGGPLARVRASVRGRRLVPTGLALVGTDLLQRLMLVLRPGRLAAGTAAMEAVVGGTPAEESVPGLARRHVSAMARGWELTWRPWELRKVPIDDLPRLRAAHAEGRGLLISYPHLGPPAAWVSLANSLRPVHCPVGDWALDDPRPGYNGYQVEHRRKLYCDAGFELLHANGSARTLIRVLKGGGIVHLAMDLPGQTPTPFLGKTVEMADGTARLAKMTDCLIVPAALVPRGRRWAVHVEETVDPRDYASPADLHQALAVIHEKFIMSAPEHLEDPLRPGGWAEATRHGWRRA
jgi:lauroyl/myristoyl acyltransferase